jgi:hypothetical protein
VATVIKLSFDLYYVSMTMELSSNKSLGRAALKSKQKKRKKMKERAMVSKNLQL